MTTLTIQLEINFQSISDDSLRECRSLIQFFIDKKDSYNALRVSNAFIELASFERNSGELCPVGFSFVMKMLAPLNFSIYELMGV